MARVRFLGIVRDWMRCSRLEAPANTLREVLQAMRETVRCDIWATGENKPHSPWGESEEGRRPAPLGRARGEG